MTFADIYDQYARDVHRFSLYLCGDYGLAEDLTAETFVRALCAPAELKVDTVKAYLLAIARNLYRDAVARERRLVPLGEASETAAAEPSPYTAAENQQALSTVLRAIQKLPETQRETLVLSLDTELRHEDIAAILNCSVAAVKVRIHRARLQLRLDLKAEEKA